MSIPAINTSQINAMVAQLRAAAANMEAGANSISGSQAAAAPKLDFGQVLKASLDQTNQMQTSAEDLGKRFAMGDDKVSLSDVMISMQKANISLQTVSQVRTKLVAAYQNIMSMQI